ncbi:IclR family transcriptional regulator [Nocardioides sp. Bht2]|uniref:IclR family transcriptional regulator n=1 Tax=Nocardioides sp. Bht2 TaxID=3392297 RepID=UPI0039B6B98C
MPVMDRVEAAPNAVLERVTVLLDTFQGASSLTLSEITRRSGLARSSVHRLLEQLVALGWVTRNGTRYELGLRMLELGTLVLHHHTVRQVAAPFLHDLHRATGLAVHLGVLDGADTVYLDRVGSLGAGTLPSRIGGRMPAHASAIGKALLAAANWRPNAEKMVALTPRTITQPDVLMRQLHGIRQSQIAWEKEESVPGISCAAVAVRAQQSAVAALSVTGRSGAVTEKVTPYLRTTAQRIGQHLSDAGYVTAR